MSESTHHEAEPETSTPTAEVIPRTGRGTGAGEHAGGEAAAWSDVTARLRDGSGTTWLSVRSAHGVHTRPLFAAWTGQSFVFASKRSAAKTRRLEESPGDGVSLAIDLSTLHLVVEGRVVRLTDRAGLERAATAMNEVYDWPAEVAGEELDAPYAAPTSGGPPFQAFELTPARVLAFPTADQVEATRFTF